MENIETIKDGPKNKFLTFRNFFYCLFLVLAIYLWWVGFLTLLAGMFELGNSKSCDAWINACRGWHSPFGVYFDLGWFLFSGMIMTLSVYSNFIKGKIKTGFFLLILILFGFLVLAAIESLLSGTSKKPVIYLYPKQEQAVSVKLKYQGELTALYPAFNDTTNQWDITAYPDGHLINKADDKEYSYLFWEGKNSKPIDWDFSRGFIVKGEDTREFLQKKLSEMGLTPREYNEFIVYWYPLMKVNKYNLIHFADEQYTQTAPLTINPKPDSMLRVFMVYKKLDKEINIEPQQLKPFNREGFTVIEWGGTEVR